MNDLLDFLLGLWRWRNTQRLTQNL
jgi:hypothetical protein